VDTGSDQKRITLRTGATKTHRLSWPNSILTLTGPPTTSSWKPLAGPTLPQHRSETSIIQFSLFAQKHFHYVEPREVDDKRKLRPISDAAYEAITPALRLATLFITEPKILGPFDHVANGVVTTDGDGDYYIRRGISEETPHGLEYVHAIFRFMMTNRLCFIFEKQRRDVGDPKATMKPHTKGLIDLSMPFRGQTYTRKVRDARVIIHIHLPGWLDYLEHDTASARPAHQLNALLDLTMLIMHEVMHAFHVFAGQSLVSLDGDGPD